MANSGYKWAEWVAMQRSAGDWTADAIADAATEAGDATELDLKAGCEVGLTLVAGAGAIDGDVTVYILREVSTGVYEETTNSGARAFNITPVESDTVFKSFAIDPSQIGSFIISLENQAGQSITATVKYRTADWPVAS